MRYIDDYYSGTTSAMAVAITPVPTNATYLDRNVSRIMTCPYNESESRRQLDDKLIDDDSAEKKNEDE
jgi:hypothetical protein